MEVEREEGSDLVKVKLTRKDIREILCGETVTDTKRYVGTIEIERIDDADASRTEFKAPYGVSTIFGFTDWRVTYGIPGK